MHARTGVNADLRKNNPVPVDKQGPGYSGVFDPHQYRATTGPLPKGSLPIGALPTGPAATGTGSLRGKSAAIALPTNATDASIPKRNLNIDTSHPCRQPNNVTRDLFQRLGEFHRALWQNCTISMHAPRRRPPDWQQMQASEMQPRQRSETPRRVFLAREPLSQRIPMQNLRKSAVMLSPNDLAALELAVAIVHRHPERSRELMELIHRSYGCSV